MGIGSSRGEDRAVAAAEMAISSPLLEATIDGAHGVLLSIQGGSDLGLFEINEAAQLVANSAAVDANIIFGAVIDDALGDEVRVTVIAAGFDESQMGRTAPRVEAGAAAPSPPLRHPRAAAPRRWVRARRPCRTRLPCPPLPCPPRRRPPAPARGTARSRPAREMTRPRRSLWAHRARQPGRAARLVPMWPLWRRPRFPPGRTASIVSRRPLGWRTARPRALMRPAPTPLTRLPGTSRRPRTASRRSAADAPAAARVFDVAATRRRPVIFEEDDDLDVPDFLK